MNRFLSFIYLFILSFGMVGSVFDISCVCLLVRGGINEVCLIEGF